MHASARLENIAKSVFKYVEDNLIDASGLPTGFVAADVQWPDISFDTDKHDQFLRVTLHDSEGQAYDCVNSGSPGHLKSWSLILQAFIRREKIRQEDERYLLPKTLDMVKDAFPVEQLVTVLDYASGANTNLGSLEVVSREPHNPKDDSWVSGGWMIGLRGVEIDT